MNARKQMTGREALGSFVTGVAMLAFLWWLLGSPPIDRVVANVLDYFHALGSVLGS